MIMPRAHSMACRPVIVPVERAGSTGVANGPIRSSHRAGIGVQSKVLHGSRELSGTKEEACWRLGIAEGERSAAAKAAGGDGGSSPARTLGNGWSG